MTRIEHDTDEATERDEWRLVDGTSAIVRIMRIVGVIFIALAITAGIHGGAV